MICWRGVYAWKNTRQRRSLAAAEPAQHTGNDAERMQFFPGGVANSRTPALQGCTAVIPYYRHLPTRRLDSEIFFSKHARRACFF